MLSIARPTDDAIRKYLDSRRGAAYRYEPVGATREAAAPAGYVVDRHRVRLGAHDDAFARGVQAVRRWAMFPPEVVRLCWPDTPIEAGEVVAGLYRGMGLWAVMPCRIVYVIDEETAEARRFGFAYGTLPGHPESGEERFLVEQQHDTSEVSYDLFAFSRPGMWLTRLAYRFVRREQARFRRLSGDAMVRWISR